MRVGDLPWTRVVSYYGRPASFDTGGVNTSRAQWMKAFATCGIDVKMLYAKGGFDSRLAASDRLQHESISHTGRSRMTMIPHLKDQLRRTDLVYLHEGWTPSNIVVAEHCRQHDIDYVVMPHGVYAAALVNDLRGLKVRKLLEARMLKRALATHLFFEAEISEVERICSGARTIVSVTGFDVPEVVDQSFARPYLAWLGRYDINHKGIDRLFEALASIPADQRPRVRMHGPDHRGDEERVRELVDRLSLAGCVDVGGPLEGDAVRQFLAESRGFVHVPRWEAFGRTIVEAMSVGTPVLLGTDAHIATDLAMAGAVTVVEAEHRSDLAASLLRIWRGEIGNGQQGRQWVRDNLAWQTRATSALVQLDKQKRRNRAAT